VHATHSFWDVKDDTGQELIISGGPNILQGTEYLNVGWSSPANAGANASGKIWYDTGTSAAECAYAEGVEFFAYLFPNNTVKYNPTNGPNSNSLARYLGNQAGLYPTKPPGAFGWDYLLYPF
jgi:hypothetical protein